MVGVLCTPQKESAFAAELPEYLQPELGKGYCSAAVFTMKNLNLTERTVYGSLLTASGISTGRTALPGVIFNFSVQHAWGDIRKLHALKETPNLKLLNPANFFDQRAMLEMLASRKETTAYVLPFGNIEKTDVPAYDFSGDFILRPEKGLDAAKMLYGHQTAYGYDLYSGEGGPYSKQYDIRGAVAPLIGGSSLILHAPELLMDVGTPRLVRGYLRRETNGEWQIALRTVPGQGGRIFRRTGGRADAALFKITRCLSSYMPELVFCTVDLVFDRDSKPYFTGLGGWQNLTPGKRRSRPLLYALGRSMVTLSAAQSRGNESE